VLIPDKSAPVLPDSVTSLVSSLGGGGDSGYGIKKDYKFLINNPSPIPNLYVLPIDLAILFVAHVLVGLARIDA
jgi:hypothetical protein